MLEANLFVEPGITSCAACVRKCIASQAIVTDNHGFVVQQYSIVDGVRFTQSPFGLCLSRADLT